MNTCDKTAARRVMASVLLGVAAISWVDAVWQPPYAVKSAIKVCLFVGLPVLCSWRLGGALDLRSLFIGKGGKRGVGEALAWGGAVFAAILGAYLLLRRYFDFSRITANLESTMGIRRDNFIWVTLYICLCNSLLEEFFFRGFACLSLRRAGASQRGAYLFSALAFAAYHVAMMWAIFPLPLVLACLAGLAVGGCLFNFFNERHGTLYTSWLIHMAANLAINGIAMHLFGMF